MSLRDLRSRTLPNGLAHSRYTCKFLRSNCLAGKVVRNEAKSSIISC